MRRPAVLIVASFLALAVVVLGVSSGDRSHRQASWWSWTSNTSSSGYCGDGFLDDGDECDDANDVLGDGCSQCMLDVPETTTGDEDGSGSEGFPSCFDWYTPDQVFTQMEWYLTTTFGCSLYGSGDVPSCFAGYSYEQVYTQLEWYLTTTFGCSLFTDAGDTGGTGGGTVGGDGQDGSGGEVGETGGAGGEGGSTSGDGESLSGEDGGWGGDTTDGDDDEGSEDTPVPSCSDPMWENMTDEELDALIQALEAELNDEETAFRRDDGGLALQAAVAAAKCEDQSVYVENVPGTAIPITRCPLPGVGQSYSDCGGPFDIPALNCLPTSPTLPATCRCQEFFTYRARVQAYLASAQCARLRCREVLLGQRGPCPEGQICLRVAGEVQCEYSCRAPNRTLCAGGGCPSGTACQNSPHGGCWCNTPPVQEVGVPCANRRGPAYNEPCQTVGTTGGCLAGTTCQTVGAALNFTGCSCR